MPLLYHAATSYHMKRKYNSRMSVIMFIPILFSGWSNSAINPFIYAFYSAGRKVSIIHAY